MLDGYCFVDLRVFLPFSFMRLSFSFGYIIGSDDDDDDDDDDCKRTSWFLSFERERFYDGRIRCSNIYTCTLNLRFFNRF
jgi:hypothetical protein